MRRNLTVVSAVFALLLVIAQIQIGALQTQTQDQSSQNQNPKTAQPQGAQANQQPAASEPEAREQDEEGVKHLLVSQIDAWNRGNLQGFMAGYWHSPDLTFFSGTTVTKGWEPTLQRYQQRYKGEGKEMGQLEFQDLKIDLMGRRAAVVTGKWQLTMSDGKKPGGLFTLIFKRLPGGWRIVHDHTSGG
jgi:beta-aspartyl-peptidase (threonine type)